MVKSHKCSTYQYLLTSASLAMIFQATGFNRGINDDGKRVVFYGIRGAHSERKTVHRATTNGAWY